MELISDTVDPARLDEMRYGLIQAFRRAVHGRHKSGVSHGIGRQQTSAQQRNAVAPHDDTAPLIIERRSPMS